MPSQYVTNTQSTNVLPRKRFRVRWDQVSAMLVTVLCLGLLMVWFGVLIEPMPADSLPPCATEDSDNCVWDAAKMGNGEGESFYVVDGAVHHVPACTDEIADAGGVCIGEPQ